MLSYGNTFEAIRVCLWQVLRADVTRNKSIFSNHITQQWNIVGYTYKQHWNTSLWSTLCMAYLLYVFARDSIYAKRAHAIAIPSVRLSVRLSVRHTGDSCKNGWS